MVSIENESTVTENSITGASLAEDEDSQVRTNVYQADEDDSNLKPPSNSTT